MSIPYVRVFGLLMGFIFFSPSVVQAQTIRPVISASLGVIENTQRAPDLPTKALYPQLEVSTTLFRGKRSRFSLGVSLYTGGWTDGVNKPSRSKDMITFSYSNFVVGSRISVTLDKFPLPLLFWTGVSRQFLFADYIGGTGITGNVGKDYRDATNAIEVGTRLQVPISGRIKVGGEVQVYRTLSQSANFSASTNRPYSVVVSYSL